ncbi:MAG: hypothetical protein HC809_00705 [Gammaproteobacteria bacterium]|nr:hypothetical protein [Gammaproteobacteria bacterium]
MELRQHHDGDDTVVLQSSRPLESAVLSLLINAAQASAAADAKFVDFASATGEHVVTMRIRDYGAGFEGQQHRSRNGMGVGSSSVRQRSNDTAARRDISAVVPAPKSW